MARNDPASETDAFVRGNGDEVSTKLLCSLEVFSHSHKHEMNVSKVFE